MANLKAGAVRAESGQAQHVDFFRKILLRKRLLAKAISGAAYVPFIGDGDIASELYAGKFKIYGADLDHQRIATASTRLPSDSIIRVADCNGWPFVSADTEPFSVADFDAYSEPYESFRSFWANADKADKMVLFFTDGHLWPLVFRGHWHKPDGTIEKIDHPPTKKMIYNFYFPKHIKPWFAKFVSPWRVLSTQTYKRANRMLYWGAVIER